MNVLLAPTEPDACAAQRTPEHIRRAAAVISHGRPRAPDLAVVPRHEPEVACERRPPLQRKAR